MDLENEVEDTSPRADLEAAFEAHENEQAGRPNEDTPEPVRTSEQAPAEGTPAVRAEEAPADPAAKAAADPGKSKSEAGKPAEGAPDAKQAPVEVSAPVAWKKEAKAVWGQVPPAAQLEISRREAETAKAMAHSTNARKLWDEYHQTVAPFMPLIRAQNSEPMAAIKNLMTTAAGLTVGTPEQKARIVAEIIGNFQIDVETLDNVLSQSQLPSQGAPGTSQVEVAMQRALSPVFQFMDTVKQGQAARLNQMRTDADMEVNTFADSHDFFDDLRDDIADLMEMNAQRGRQMTLQRAYDIALAQNPELSAVAEQRKAAAAAQNRNGTVARARTAASSIVGSPNLSPGKTGSEPASRRGDIMAAWDELSGQ